MYYYCPIINSYSEYPPYIFLNQFSNIYTNLSLLEQEQKRRIQFKNSFLEQYASKQPYHTNQNQQIELPLKKQNEVEDSNFKKSYHSTQDDDYVPFKEIKRKQRQISQNRQRNVMPNLIHQIFRFLICENKSGRLVRKLIKLIGKNKAAYKKFYLFVKGQKKRINRYVNLKEFLQILKPVKSVLEDIIVKEQVDIYREISRRLTRYFLLNEGFCVILNSLKIKKQNRIYNLIAQRKILFELSQGRVLLLQQ